MTLSAVIRQVWVAPSFQNPILPEDTTSFQSNPRNLSVSPFVESVVKSESQIFYLCMVMNIKNA